MGRTLPLIIAVVAGILAAGLTYSYLQTQKQATKQLKSLVEKQKAELVRLNQQLRSLASRGRRVEEKVPVVVAKRDISAGEILTSEMVEEKFVPREVRISSAAGSVDAVIGKMVTSDVVKGEQIILSKLISPEVARKELIPPGTRLVTIKVEQTDLFRFVRPGDKVDISVIFTLPGSQVVNVGLFSGVEIKAVNGRISYGFRRPNKRSSGGKIQKRNNKGEEKVIKINPNVGTLTFALPLKEAAILTMAAKIGKIEIYPRSSLDPDKEKLPPTTVDTVFQYALPQLVAQIQSQQEQEKPLPAPIKPKAPEPKKIKVRRGSEVEVVKLGAPALPSEKGVELEEESVFPSEGEGVREKRPRSWQKLKKEFERDLSDKFYSPDFSDEDGDYEKDLSPWAEEGEENLGVGPRVRMSDIEPSMGSS